MISIKNFTPPKPPTDLRSVLTGEDGDWFSLQIDNQVILDPARKDGSWLVFFDGRVVADGYNSKGAAEAALGLYVSGYRKVKNG